MLSKFRKIGFLVVFTIPIFWQEVIFKSLALEFKFSKIFIFFYNDITSWYIVVCLKRINWKLYWTSFGKQKYWDLVFFLEFFRKKNSHAISWIFAATVLRTSQLVSIRSPRRGEQLTSTRGESNKPGTFSKWALKIKKMGVFSLFFQMSIFISESLLEIQFGVQYKYKI